MTGTTKSRDELQSELETLRAHVAELERAERGRKRAEEALRESEARLRQLADTIEDVIWITDWSDRRILFASPAYKRIWGRSLQALYDNPKDWAEGIHPDDRQRAWQAFLELEDGGTYDEEYRIVRPDGSVRWVRDRGFPVRDDQGRVYRVAGIAQDITERKRAADALQESERFLQNVFAAIDDGISVLDRDLNIVRVNPWHEKHYAHQAPLTGKKCYAAYQQRQTVCPWCPSVKAVESGETQRAEVPYPCEENSMAWIDLSAYPLKNADGQVVGVIEYVKDITERKRAEEALRESEQTVRSLVETSRDWIWSTDTQARHTYCSPAIEAILGYKPDELMGKPSLPLIHDEDRRMVEARWPGWLADKSGWNNLLIRWRHKDGGYRYLESNAVPILDAAGELVGFRGVDRDITERKRAEEELARHREHLEELVEERTRELAESQGRLIQAERLASVGTLAAGIAHEINNPVGGILLAAQNAQQHRTGPDGDQIIDRALDKIVDQAKRCSRIVKSVLQFARDDTTDKWPTDLNGILRRVVDLTRKHAWERGAEVEFQATEDPGEVVVNPLGMEQVLVNLIHNGIEAREAGARVIVRAEGIPEAVRIEVQDNGQGLTDEQLKHVFDPFFTTRQDSGGTGLGLSIAHGIVTDHGGRISIDSQVGQGTTVVVELPRRASSREEAVHVEGAGG